MPTARASFHSPKLELRDAGAKGIGLFAREPIARGEVVLVTAGCVLTPDEHRTFAYPDLPFQIATDLHLGPYHPTRPEGIFAVNHSCAPSCAIAGQTGLVTLRDLAESDEITYDYVTTDSDSPHITPFRMGCLCGAATCRGEVTDRDWRRPDLRERLRGTFSAYLQARIDAEGV